MIKKTTIMESKIYQKLAGNKASKILDSYKMRRIMTQSGGNNNIELRKIRLKILANINNILQSKYNIFDYTRDRAIQLFVAFKCGVLKRNKKYLEKDIIKMKIGTAKTKSLSSFLGFLEINKYN